jgi:hypothetical protein
MLVFSLATDIDGDLDVTLHSTRGAALRIAAREMLGADDKGLPRILQLITEGRELAAVEMLHELMIEQNGACGTYRILEHTLELDSIEVSSA